MSRKNAGFIADLAAGIDKPDANPKPRRTGMSTNVLADRENRLAELAAGSAITRTQELIDPARCRMWPGHNRQYSMLNEERCADLIESIKAQGRQEIPAIVRRVKDDPHHDFEVVCGARRHWAISWLRTHNYPDFRYLVEIRNLSDEEAFRLADLENRARDDLTDLERARDYLRALDSYYQGRQKDMAERMNVTQSWLSRYLDLARLPAEIMVAFARPHDLRIKHITAIKPLLKPEASRIKVFAEASRIAGEAVTHNQSVPDIIRALARAAQTEPTSRTTGKSAAKSILSSKAGNPLLRVENKDRQGLHLTLLLHAGGSRKDVEAALKTVLDRHWP
ncbi:ParB/RepB/Spo0J family partition protein [Croceicoccus sp. F390]|uniref:ParB/RepB/Spo0J family partition protein n=1 Tax=Croceicoccus esteveae TaxID=3075597 RepID=A0ABU2ZNP1_9SPHN|nr:ParB/RepB/Spo0J family partition protein [Croceicoccus sp. F390]MDT0577169.1 ParB/RepB/Spo0J family partition protein [Croceicoccus sp. F390]